MEHTKEPWHVNDKSESGWHDHAIYIAGNRGENIARVYRDFGNAEQTARRIVACVNACYGIPTDQLERVSNNPTPVFELLLQTTNERDSLNKLCEFNERTMAELVNTLDSVLEELDKAAKYHASHECYAEAKRVEFFIASIKGESK